MIQTCEVGSFDISNPITAQQTFSITFVDFIVIAAAHRQFSRDEAIDDVSADEGESHRHSIHFPQQDQTRLSGANIILSYPFPSK